MATPAFVDQFKGYVERWVSRQQSQVAPAPADPKGPGRPCELPSEILWSRLLLCVLHRARGVRDVWRALVCQGYDLCDEAVYARLDSGGTEPLQALFAQLTTMLAAWVQALLDRQPGEPLASAGQASCGNLVVLPLHAAISWNQWGKPRHSMSGTTRSASEM